MPAMQAPSVGWLLGLLDDGRLVDIDGVTINLRDGVTMESIAQDDGAIAGTAKIGGTNVAVFAQEPSYKGGSMGLMHTKRLERLVSIATERKVPLIGLYDSGGVRVQEGGNSLEEASRLVGQLMKARDVVPVINAIMGTASGAATYAANAGDVLIMIRGRSKMFVWGPGVVKVETGKDVETEELGGADVHSSNGTVSLVVENETECIELVRRVLGYTATTAPRNPSSPEAVPVSTGAMGIINATFDAESFLEFRGFYARSVITGLARLAGRAVGVVASNKEVLSGFMDVDACRKVSRFAGMCNSLRIPLVTFLDCPGVYPSVEQERAGLVAASSEAIKEYASDRAPKVTVVAGEAYGGIFVGFASKALGARKVFAYPQAKVSVMGLSPYLEIFQKKKLDALAGEARKTEFDRVVADFLKQMDPSIGVSKGYVDEIIEPNETRSKLIDAFRD